MSRTTEFEKWLRLSAEQTFDLCGKYQREAEAAEARVTELEASLEAHRHQILRAAHLACEAPDKSQPGAWLVCACCRKLHALLFVERTAASASTGEERAGKTLESSAESARPSEARHDREKCPHPPAEQYRDHDGEVWCGLCDPPHDEPRTTEATPGLAIGAKVLIPGEVTVVYHDGAVRVRFTALGSERYSMSFRPEHLHPCTDYPRPEAVSTTDQERAHDIIKRESLDHTDAGWLVELIEQVRAETAQEYLRTDTARPSVDVFNETKGKDPKEHGGDDDCG